MASSKPRNQTEVETDADPILARLQDRLGHRFTKPQLLERALTHPSVSADPRHSGGDYERLEFLGDRVLGLVVAEMLFQHFPREAEGPLARRLAKLVDKETLAAVAMEIDLGAAMRFSMGEDEAQGRANPGLLSDACEAVIAALYLDGGLEVAERFISSAWRHHLEADRVPPTDSKTALQEWAQGRGLPLPAYREIGRQGPPHDPVFTIEVSVEGWPAQSGRGGSKRKAERDAATRLLALVTGDEQ